MKGKIDGLLIESVLQDKDTALLLFKRITRNRKILRKIPLSFFKKEESDFKSVAWRDEKGTLLNQHDNFYNSIITGFSRYFLKVCRKAAPVAPSTLR